MQRRNPWFAVVLTVSGAASATATPGTDMAGWSKLSARASVEPACSVELPRLPLRQAVATMVQHPADLARPIVHCDGPLPVPLAADPMLLERVEGQEPTLSWTPHLTPHARGGGLIVVDVDVLPLRPAAPAIDPSIPRPLTPAPAVRNYEPPRVRRDPTRPGASEAEPALFTTQPIPPVIAARRLQSIDSDVLAVASGGSWLAVDLAVERGRLLWYRLTEAEMFGLPGRLVVAPTPRHPRALLELLAVDPSTAAVTSLGRPTAVGGTWRQELSDLRERAGTLEALLIVRDASPRGDIDGPVFAALLRREAAGAWTQVGATPLPGGVMPRSLRFDPADPKALILTMPDGSWVHRLP